MEKIQHLIKTDVDISKNFSKKKSFTTFPLDSRGKAHSSAERKQSLKSTIVLVYEARHVSSASGSRLALRGTTMHELRIAWRERRRGSPRGRAISEGTTARRGARWSFRGIPLLNIQTRERASADLGAVRSIASEKSGALYARRKGNRRSGGGVEQFLRSNAPLFFPRRRCRHFWHLPRSACRAEPFSPAKSRATPRGSLLFRSRAYTKT